MKKYLSFRSMTAALVIASLTAVSVTPAMADGWRRGGHGYHGGGYHHGHHGGGSDGSDIALAAIGGLLLGAVLMDASNNPQNWGGQRNAGYYAPQGPVDAMPASDTYRASNGQYCRDFEATNGESGTACLDSDGVWRTVN